MYCLINFLLLIIHQSPLSTKVLSVEAARLQTQDFKTMHFVPLRIELTDGQVGRGDRKGNRVPIPLLTSPFSVCEGITDPRICHGLWMVIYPDFVFHSTQMDITPRPLSIRPKFINIHNSYAS